MDKVIETIRGVNKVCKLKLYFHATCFDKENHRYHDEYFAKDLRGFDFIPRKGDDVILNDMEFIVKSVMWDYDAEIIAIHAENIQFGEYEVDEYHKFVEKWNKL